MSVNGPLSPMRQEMAVAGSGSEMVIDPALVRAHRRQRRDEARRIEHVAKRCQPAAAAVQPVGKLRLVDEIFEQPAVLFVSHELGQRLGLAALVGQRLDAEAIFGKLLRQKEIGRREIRIGRDEGVELVEALGVVELQEMDQLDRQRLALVGKRAEHFARAGLAVLHAQQRGKAHIGIDGVDVETGKGEIGAPCIQHVARQFVARALW